MCYSFIPQVAFLAEPGETFAPSQMIESFYCKETEKIFNRGTSRKLPPEIQRVALRKLKYLNNAVTLQDLRVPPNNRLEALKGDRKGQHSIGINNQWRVCFFWSGKNAQKVEIADYH